MPAETILLRNRYNPAARSIEGYRASGGYQALQKAIQMGPQAVVEEVKKANLRGRGGAGFPAGTKWTFLPPREKRTVTYLCVNADESEPPTFNNRTLMETDPHQLIEGILIASFANAVTRAYIYIRAEMHEQYHILARAVEEACAAGLIGPNILGSGYGVDVYVHRGAGAYVCGEETGLIESLEGKRGWPRIKPPFPAVAGLFGKPTIINNVETLCCVPHIIERGADWFLSVGPAGSSGPKLFCVSGPVRKPGVYEAAMGLPLKDLLFADEFAGGMLPGHELKASFPGGLSMGVLTAAESMEMSMDFDAPRKFGLLGLGTAAVVVVSDQHRMADVLANVARFYAHESCGQCTQCREGTGWMYKIARRIADGAGRPEDLNLLAEITRNMGMMPGMSICGLPDGAAFPVRTIVEKFRPELEATIAAQRPGAFEAYTARFNLITTDQLAASYSGRLLAAH